MGIFKIISDLKNQFLEKRRNLLDREAEKILQKNDGLWKELVSYREHSTSTGCWYFDYVTLYNYIRRVRPKEVLECGTGVSTVVMAYAMMENGGGRITSMEENKDFYDVACGALSQTSLKKYVDIVFSSTVEDSHSIFRGMRYKDIPDRPYTFVFVDGPYPRELFDFDFVHVVKNSKNNEQICGIIDMRHSTCYAMQEIFGPQKFRYDFVRDLGFIGPCSKNDVRSTRQIAGSPISRPFRIYRICKQEVKSFLKI